MNKRGYILALLSLCGSFCLPLWAPGFGASQARAQSAPWGVRAPVSYRSWEYSDSTGKITTSQLVVPVTASVPLGQVFELALSGAFQSATVDAPGSPKLSGAADTRLGLTMKMLQGRLLLQVGLNFPTGIRELDPKQQLLAASLAPPVLGFRVRQPGKGLDVGGGITGALPLGTGWSLGLGAGYVSRGRFRPVQGGAKVRPGAETSISAGLDGRLGPFLTRLDGTHRFYGKDEGGAPGFEEPAVWEASLGISTMTGPWLMSGIGLFSDKAKSDLSFANFSGTYGGASLSLRRALGERFSLGVDGEVTHFKSSGKASSGGLKSTTEGAGPSMGLRLSRLLSVDAHVLRLAGDIPGNKIHGWDASCSLSIQPPAEEE
jgi:hypothetical protein